MDDRVGGVYMKRLLLIRGDIAAGKSVFADILSRRYHTNYFSKDSIKEILGDTVGFSNREENLKLSKAAIEMMFFLFSEFAKFGKNLILESNFHTNELERICQIAYEKEYNILTLDISGDIDILYQRYLNRMYHENRHPVHLSTTIDIFEDFKKCIEHIRKERIPGSVIHINANDFSYQTYKLLLAEIDEFMTK